MAVSEAATIESWIAGSTFAASDVYKLVEADAEGHVLIGASSNMWPVGVLYGQTKTTTTESEAVPVAVWGTVKVRAVASTMHAGNVFGCSTAGYAIAPSSDYVACGIIKYGSSGGTGRILSGQLWKFGQKTQNPA